MNRSTNIPFFYGNKNWDNDLTPQKLLDRLDKAAAIAGWDVRTNMQEAGIEEGKRRGDRRRCEELHLCLRRNAIDWYQNLSWSVINNWTLLKEAFLKAFSPEAEEQPSSHLNMVKLQQGKEEAVDDNYVRVSEAFKTNIWPILQDKLLKLSTSENEEQQS